MSPSSVPAQPVWPCAIEAQKAGFRAINIDKGCLVNSLYNYPANMIFFTTPELLEIGDIPFTTAHQKPTRSEALEYYRKVTEHYRLDVRQYENVELISGADGSFILDTRDRISVARQYHCRKVVIANGFYDLPNMMGIPGEELPKVHHYYGEPHPYFDADVLVIGGKNSAAIAALELWRHGARVTLVHRGPEYIRTSSTGSNPISKTASGTARSRHTSTRSRRKSRRRPSYCKRLTVN
jgi:thioredoxin reductase (NADPH)